MWSWLRRRLARRPSLPPPGAAPARPAETGISTAPGRAAPPPDDGVIPALAWRPGDALPDTAAVFSAEGDAPAAPEPAGLIVGIDLGTTRSAVAVLRGGRVELVPNQEGELMTPSVVAFTDDGAPLVGEAARRQALANPRRTVYSFKRLLGRPHDEAESLGERLPYRVVADPGAAPGVEVGGRPYAVTEIAALVLRKLKDDAEAHLGRPVRHAVITVPAYFDGAQRQATVDAARIAGWEVDWLLADPATGKTSRQPMRVINEPTAAALAHGLGRRGAERVAVLHLGGGTFDVSILDVGDGVFEVKAVGGDSHLGGDDFDAVLVEALADACRRAHGIDPRADPVALARLRDAAERAKRDLTQAHETTILLPHLAAGKDGPVRLHARVTRDQFDRLTAPLVERLRVAALRALADSGWGVSDIDSVVLVGGMTRVPRVRETFRSIFDGRPTSVSPDEAVAAGAAIQGA